MITHLESEMIKAIQREFNNSDEWIERLSDTRRDKLNEEVNKAKSKDVFVNMLLITQFNDKVTIIRRSPDFPWSKTKFKEDLGEVESLRDMVAHANQYASDHDEARNACKTVRLMDHWIAELANWPRPSAGPP
jgi:hypothetical protein